MLPVFHDTLDGITDALMTKVVSSRSYELNLWLSYKQVSAIKCQVTVHILSAVSWGQEDTYYIGEERRSDSGVFEIFLGSKSGVDVLMHELGHVLHDSLGRSTINGDNPNEQAADTAMLAMLNISELYKIIDEFQPPDCGCKGTLTGSRNTYSNHFN